MENIFSINLNYIKRINGLENKDLCNLIGVTSSTVSNLLNNKTQPSAEALLKISNEYNYTVDDLLKKDISKQVQEYDVSSYLNETLEPVQHPLGYTPKTGKIYKTKTPLEDALRFEIDKIVTNRVKDIRERVERLELIHKIDNEIKGVKKTS